MDGLSLLILSFTQKTEAILFLCIQLTFCVCHKWKSFFLPVCNMFGVFVAFWEVEELVWMRGLAAGVQGMLNAKNAFSVSLFKYHSSLLQSSRCGERCADITELSSCYLSPLSLVPTRMFSTSARRIPATPVAHTASKSLHLKCDWFKESRDGEFSCGHTLCYGPVLVEFKVSVLTPLFNCTVCFTGH